MDKKKTILTLSQEARSFLFTQLLEQTDDVVTIHEADTMRMVYCNDGASQALGYERNELYSLNPMQYFTVFPDRAGWDYFINTLLRPQKIMGGANESQLKKKGGTLFSVGGTIEAQSGGPGQGMTIVLILWQENAVDAAVTAARKK